MKRKTCPSAYEVITGQNKQGVKYAAFQYKLMVPPEINTQINKLVNFNKKKLKQKMSMMFLKWLYARCTLICPVN